MEVSDKKGEVVRRSPARGDDHGQVEMDSSDSSERRSGDTDTGVEQAPEPPPGGLFSEVAPSASSKDTGAAVPHAPAETVASARLEGMEAALLDDDGIDYDLDALFSEEGTDLSEDFLEEGVDADQEDGDLEDEALGWAIGSELEFVDDPATDTWDGPTGDGLDDEEGQGGFSLRPTIAPRPPDKLVPEDERLE